MSGAKEKNFYEILGVEKGTSADEIKRAYRKLALKYHPDKNPGDEGAETRFKELAAAYEVLRDPERRREYDDALASGGRPSFHDSQGFAGDPRAWSTEDILSRFRDLFGGDFGSTYHGGRPRGRSGFDISAELSVDFATAALGGSVEVQIEGEAACGGCGGRGAVGASGPCGTCGGSGRVTRQSGQPEQLFTVTKECPACGGTGVGGGELCLECGGSSVVSKRRRVKVKIPEGLRDGEKIRLRGLGGAGTYGERAGDLFVLVKVIADPQFRRERDDVHSDLRVPVATAALGGKVLVRTLRGQARLAVPPNSSSGRMLRLKGQGIKGGDHVVRVMIVLPESLSEEQRKLLASLGD